jgi:hypothetical protein
MMKSKYWILIGVIIVLIAALAISGCTSSSSSSDNKSPTATPTAAATTAPTAAAATAKPTATPAPTPTPAPSTVGLSKTNPASIGTTITYKPSDWAATMYGSTYKITLIEVKKGSDANSAMAAINQFYKPSSSSNDFLLAHFKIEVTDSSPADKSYKISSYSNFKAANSDGTKIYDSIFYSYDPKIDGEVYKGGSADGWVCLEVAKTDTIPLIVFVRDYNGKDGIWFSTA